MTRIDLRIPPDVAAIVAALAESHSDPRGGRTAAITEALRVFWPAAQHAYAANAAEFSSKEWTILAHAMPDADPGTLYEVSGAYPADWSAVIAQELSDLHHGRAVVLQSHKDEQRAAKALAKRVSSIGPMRGWAMMDALRRFWRHKELPERWWEWDAEWTDEPEVR